MALGRIMEKVRKIAELAANYYKAIFSAAAANRFWLQIGIFYLCPRSGRAKNKFFLPP